MVTKAKIGSAEDLAEILRSGTRVNSVKSGMSWSSGVSQDAVEVDLSGLSGIVNFSPGDQVVVVRTGTPLRQLLDELSVRGHTLPLPNSTTPIPVSAPLIAHLDWNFPSPFGAAYGSWKDWILGMQIVRASGEIARSGSRVVKSVAGFDIHKFLIGARGSLGICTEVNLRTFPIKAMTRDAPKVPEIPALPDPLWMHCVLPRHVEPELRRTESVLMHDSDSGWIWSTGRKPNRIDGDTLLGIENGHLVEDKLMHHDLFMRAKERFDPLNQLNPGIWGEAQ